MPDASGKIKGIAVPRIPWHIDPDDPCQSASCTRMNGKCVGWHCAHCGEPCSSQGHANCSAAAQR